MIEENDVVQIVPEHDWSGCYVTVTEVKTWGIQGFVQIPKQGQAFIRLRNDEFEKIGEASFILVEETEEL